MNKTSAAFDNAIQTWKKETEEHDGKSLLFRNCLLFSYLLLEYGNQVDKRKKNIVSNKYYFETKCTAYEFCCGFLPLFQLTWRMRLTCGSGHNILVPIYVGMNQHLILWINDPRRSNSFFKMYGQNPSFCQMIGDNIHWNKPSFLDENWRNLDCIIEIKVLARKCTVLVWRHVVYTLLQRHVHAENAN